MDVNGYDAAYQSLITLSEKQGYLSFDDINKCADIHSLTIQDFDRLSEAIVTRGIILYNKKTNIPNFDILGSDDYAQIDYDAIYNRIIELCPSLKTFVTNVKNILPPQRGEIKRLKDHIVEDNLHARIRMIEMYLRTALRIALARAEKYDEDLEETVEDACIGLIIAVDKYDPDTSGPFASYASFWILQNISRSQGNKRPLIYYPQNFKEKYFSIYPLAKERGCIGCNKMLECCDLRTLVMEKFECNKDKVKYIIPQMMPFISLQELLKHEECLESCEYKNILNNVLQLITVVDEDTLLNDVYRAQLSDIVSKALDTLKPNQAEVIRLRYGFFGREMTLNEIGQRFNLTRERIRQIEENALKKLKIILRGKF